jgi:hypothetical protein
VIKKLETTGKNLPKHFSPERRNTRIATPDLLGEQAVSDTQNIPSELKLTIAPG